MSSDDIKDNKEDPTGILSRTSGLAGWRKAVRRVASLEETSLNDIDELYDGLVSKTEQEEWLHEKLRLLREESEAIASSSHSVHSKQPTNNNPLPLEHTLMSRPSDAGFF